MTDRTLAPSQVAPLQIYEIGPFALHGHRGCSDARTHFGLSRRELELLMHMAAGLTKREIATRMGVTSATADTFRRRAYTKLGVNSGAAAVAIITAFLSGSQVEKKPLEVSA